MLQATTETWRCKLNGRAPRVYFLPVGEMRFIGGTVVRKVRAAPQVGWLGYLSGLVISPEPKRCRVPTRLTVSDERTIVYDLGLDTSLDSGTVLQRLGPYTLARDHRIDLCFDQAYYEDVEVILSVY
jgi:hypothetical protein